jgi:AcrR family transcriptional regulator
MPRIAPEVRQERRRALVDAAWRCAATKRFNALTIDDVCAAAGVSKGTFYGYFASKQELLLALLDDSSGALDRVMDTLDATPCSGVERVRRFTRAMLEQGADPGRTQVRADLWADILTDEDVRARLSASIERRRSRLRDWIADGSRAGNLADFPSNAVASIVLALGDGLLLHAGLDPTGFRWANITRALDMLLSGQPMPGSRPEARSADSHDAPARRGGMDGGDTP